MRKRQWRMKMENATIKHLKEMRRMRRRKYLIVFISVMGILGILNVFALMILGLFLMVVGAESLTNISDSIIKWKYYKYMTSGFHELVEAENKDRNKDLSAGLILSLAGFLIFFLSLYLSSIGWFGLITL